MKIRRHRCKPNIDIHRLSLYDNRRNKSLRVNCARQGHKSRTFCSCHAGVLLFFPNGRWMRLFLGLGSPSSSIKEESVDSSSGGVLLDCVAESWLFSRSGFCLVKVFLGGGLGSSGLATMSVLRERTICPEERGRRGGGRGAPILRMDARSCGCDWEWIARVNSSPDQLTLYKKYILNHNKLIKPNYLKYLKFQNSYRGYKSHWASTIDFIIITFKLENKNVKEQNIMTVDQRF